MSQLATILNKAAPETLQSASLLLSSSETGMLETDCQIHLLQKNLNILRKNWDLTIRYFTILLLVLSLLPVQVSAKEEWDNVSRIVVMGDLHGDYDQYLQILNDNQLIDSDLDWQGGETHLVQLGDIPDRGPDSLKIMRHLKSLAKQARSSQGYVHSLIGNHELMNIKDDLRFVHPGEYGAFINAKSIRSQRNYVNKIFAVYAKKDKSLKDTKQETLEAFKIKYPLGYVEHRYAWAPRGEVYQWVSNNNAVIKINRILFAHGGISPHQPLLPLKKINKKIRKALSVSQADAEPLVLEEGPLWYRGLSRNDARRELEPLKRMLDYYDADAIVIAHTPTPGAVIPRFNSRVFLTDVGLAKAYGGARANLVIEDQMMFAMHRGHKVEIPKNGEDLLAYLVKLSQLDPSPSPLLKTINRIRKTIAEEPTEAEESQ